MAQGVDGRKKGHGQRPDFSLAFLFGPLPSASSLTRLKAMPSRISFAKLMTSNNRAAEYSIYISLFPWP
jgi:hypothetical protein